MTYIDKTLKDVLAAWGWPSPPSGPLYVLPQGFVLSKGYIACDLKSICTGKCRECVKLAGVEP